MPGNDGNVAKGQVSQSLLVQLGASRPVDNVALVAKYDSGRCHIHIQCFTSLELFIEAHSPMSGSSPWGMWGYTVTLGFNRCYCIPNVDKWIVESMDEKIERKYKKNI